MDTKQTTKNNLDPVYDIAVSPNFTDDHTCFVAKASGLYRSTDGGHRWNSVYESLQVEGSLSTSCVCLAPDFERSQQLFAAVRGGILRSDDGGKTWTVSLLPTPAAFITSLKVSPNYADDGILLAGTLDDGILRSSNRGANWTPWNFGLFDFHVLCMGFSPGFEQDKTIFIGTESGIFKSINGGLAWGEVEFPPSFAPVISIALSPHFQISGQLFAGTEQYGLFNSSDCGKTWEAVSENKEGAVNGILVFPVDDTKTGILIMREHDFLISTDGFHTWLPFRNGFESQGQPTAITYVNSVDGKTTVFVGFSNGQVDTFTIQI